MSARAWFRPSRRSKAFVSRQLSSLSPIRPCERSCPHFCRISRYPGCLRGIVLARLGEDNGPGAIRLNFCLEQPRQLPDVADTADVVEEIEQRGDLVTREAAPCDVVEFGPQLIERRGWQGLCDGLESFLASVRLLACARTGFGGCTFGKLSGEQRSENTISGVNRGKFAGCQTVVFVGHEFQRKLDSSEELARVKREYMTGRGDSRHDEGDSVVCIAKVRAPQRRRSLGADQIGAQKRFARHSPDLADRQQQRHNRRHLAAELRTGNAGTRSARGGAVDECSVKHTCPSGGA